MRSKFHIVRFCLAIWVFSANAQTANYEMVAHYDNDNGLSQNTITAIVQGTNGFIWLATQGGLVRFDGVHFEVFNTIEIDPDCSNRIDGLAYVDGRLLVKDGRLYEQSENFLEIRGHDTITRAQQKNLLYSVCTNNFIHTGTPAFFSKDKSETYRRWDLFTANDGHEGYTHKSDQNSTGLYYFNTNTGGSLTLVFHCPERVEKSFVAGSRVYGFDGNSVLHGADRDQLMYHLSGSFPELLSTMTKDKRELFRFHQSGGNVFFYDNRQVYLLKEQAPGVIDARLLTTSAQIQGGASFLYDPKQHLLFIGTTNSGLYLFRERSFKTLLFSEFEDRKKFSVRFKFNANIYYRILPYGDSAILTTRGIISSSGRKIPNTRMPAELADELTSTSNGNFLQAGKQKGPPKYLDTQLRPVSSIRTANPHSNHDLMASFFDKDTNYFVYQNKDTAWLQRFVLNNGIPANEMDERVVISKSLFIPSTKILCVQKGINDILWMGLDKGLFRWDTKKGTINSIREFDKILVRNLYYDSSGTLWAGTYGWGWYRYREGQPVLALPLDRKKYLNVVHASIVDDAGFMWVSTNNGLFRFLKKDLDSLTSSSQMVFFNYFNKNYGFLTNEFNGGSTSAIRLKNGHFVFPTMQGLIVFNPAKVPVESISDPNMINDIYLNGKKLPAEQPLVFDANFNNFTVKLYIPFYGNRYNIQAEYRLIDGSTGWVPLKEDNIINFNRLPFGDYTLSIRILSGYGANGSYVYNISFKVKPFWFRSYWFFSIVLVTLILLVSLAFWWRIQRVKKRNVKLEYLIKKRTDLLSASEEKLRKSAEFRSQVTSLVLHDIKSPMHFLSKLSGSIYTLSEDNTTDDIREKIKTLYQSTEKISAYAQNLLSWINTQGDDYMLECTPVILLDIFMDLCERYELMAVQNRNYLYYTVSPDLVVMTRPDILEIVLRNILDNAIKYTHSGMVNISGHETDTSVCIVVADTGVSISEEKLESIWNYNNLSDVDTRSGMGYRFIHDLLAKLNGRLDISSIKGEGTKVSIFLPKIEVEIKYDV
ncbi:MAG: ATP-binding protein [Bacteroidota bacterium]